MHSGELAIQAFTQRIAADGKKSDSGNAGGGMDFACLLANFDQMSQMMQGRQEYRDVRSDAGMSAQRHRQTLSQPERKNPLYRDQDSGGSRSSGEIPGRQNFSARPEPRDGRTVYADRPMSNDAGAYEFEQSDDQPDLMSGLPDDMPDDSVFMSLPAAMLRGSDALQGGAGQQMPAQNQAFTKVAQDGPAGAPAMSQMQTLMQEAGVSDVRVNAGAAGALAQNQQADLEALSVVDDSLKMADSLDKTTGSAQLKPAAPQGLGDSAALEQNLGGQTGQEGQPGQDGRMGQALAMLRAGAGGAARITPAAGGTEAMVSAAAHAPAGAFAAEVKNAGQQQSALASARSGELQNFLTMSQDLRRNAEELTQRVMEMAARNMQRLELDLNPAGLGKMRISLDAADTDQTLKVTVAAANPATRDLIEQTLPRLRTMLAEHGMDADTQSGSYEQQSGSGSQERGSEREGGHDGGSGRRDTLFASGPLSSGASDDEAGDSPAAGGAETDDGSVNFFA